MGKRAAALLLALFVFTGCDVIRELQGAEWTEPEPARAPEAAVDSARASITFRLATQENGSPLRRFGVIDAEIVLGGEALEYVVDFPAGRDGVAGPDVRLVVHGDDVYLRSYGDASLPKGKHWLSMPLSEAHSTLAHYGVLIRYLTHPQLLSRLEPPAKAARERERIRGVWTRRYVRPDTVSELAAAAGIPESRLDELRQAPPSARRASVWVDGDGFVRRMEFPMQSAPDGALLVCTIEVYDFGAPLTVQVPPEQDVVEY